MATLEELNAAKVGDDHSLRRRDFINIAAVSFAGVGAVAVALPLINQMNPPADVLALASTEVDISKIAPGLGRIHCIVPVIGKSEGHYGCG